MKRAALILVFVGAFILRSSAQSISALSPFTCYSLPSDNAAIAWKTEIYYTPDSHYVFQDYLYISNPINNFSKGKYFTTDLKSQLAFDSIYKMDEFKEHYGLILDSINVATDTGVFRAIIPCAGSCNHLAVYHFKAVIYNGKDLILTRYYDTADQISHTYFYGVNAIYGKNAKPVMEFYENGATIICEYTTDSGKWYGELSKENTVRKTWKINNKDTIVSDLKFGNDLLKPPFYPGYAVLPTGTWTFVSSFSPYQKLFYKLSYLPINNDNGIGKYKKEFRLNLMGLND